MKETIERGYIQEKKCSVPGWGPDMDFYNKVPKKMANGLFQQGKKTVTLIYLLKLLNAPVHR